MAKLGGVLLFSYLCCRELRRTHVQGADREDRPFDAAAYRARRARELEEIQKELGGGMGQVAIMDYEAATEEEIRRRTRN